MRLNMALMGLLLSRAVLAVTLLASSRAVAASASDSMALSKEQIGKLEHPYVLFHKKDVPRLLERTRTAPWSYIWDNLNQAPPEKTDGVVNAFIYALNGDLARGRAAHRKLAELCAIPDWGQKLARSTRLDPAGLIYDLIYDLLTPEERETFSRKIAASGVVQFHNESSVAWWSQRHQHNYAPVFSSGYGIAAMAILKERPEAVEWVRRAADRTQLFLRSQDPAGGYGEGVNYWCMSMRSIFPFLDGLRNVFGVDLYREPYLTQTETTGNFLLYSLSPDRRSTLNFNDAGIQRIYDANLPVRLASACGWRQMAWLVEQDIIGAGGGAGEFEWTGHAVPLAAGNKRPFPLGDIYSFLWYDPKAPTAPLDALPRSRCFPGIGWAVMRSGWEKDGLQFGIISAPKFFGNHEHADRGSFILNAYGERFIIDSGKPFSYSDPIIESWFRGSAAHNLLLLDGEGQTSREKLVAPGRMSQFVSTPGFDYVKTENAGPYGDAVRRWDRHAIYAVPGCVVLLDQVELPKPGAVTFRFHSPGNSRILLEDRAAIFPGDVAVPGSSSGERMARRHHGADFMTSDWWKTGKPDYGMVEWTQEQVAGADLLLKSFSTVPATRTLGTGYQDYRFPSTFLDQTYPQAQELNVLTLLYPRSAGMKQSKELPVVEDLSNDTALTIKVARAGKVHFLAARKGKAGGIKAGPLAATAGFAALALDAKGATQAWLMVNGTQVSDGAGMTLTADGPLLAIGNVEEEGLRLVIDTIAPNGADICIQLPQAPVSVLSEDKTIFASLTPGMKRAEFHLPSGRTELSVLWNRAGAKTLQGKKP